MTTLYDLDDLVSGAIVAPFRPIPLPAASGQLYGAACLVGGVTVYAAGTAGAIDLYDGTSTGGTLGYSSPATTTVAAICGPLYPGVLFESGIYLNIDTATQVRGAVWFIPLLPL